MFVRLSPRRETFSISDVSTFVSVVTVGREEGYRVVRIHYVPIFQPRM